MYAEGNEPIGSKKKKKKKVRMCRCKEKKGKGREPEKERERSMLVHSLRRRTQEDMEGMQLGRHPDSPRFTQVTGKPGVKAEMR